MSFTEAETQNGSREQRNSTKSVKTIRSRAGLIGELLGDLRKSCRLPETLRVRGHYLRTHYYRSAERSRTKACRLSEHFRLRILPPGNLRLFRFPFQHVSKGLLPQRFRAPANNRSRAVTSSVSNSRNSSSMRSSAPRSREARPASRRNSFENSTIAYRHRLSCQHYF